MPGRDLEDGTICSILNKSVFERKPHVWRDATTEYSIRRLRVDQARFGVRRCPPGDNFKQLIGKFTADSGADLGHFLHRRQPIDAGHQRIMQARRDRKRRQ